MSRRLLFTDPLAGRDNTSTTKREWEMRSEEDCYVGCGPKRITNSERYGARRGTSMSYKRSTFRTTHGGRLYITGGVYKKTSGVGYLGNA